MTAGCRTSARLKTFLLASILVSLSLRIAVAQGVVTTGGNRDPFPRELVLRLEAVPYELEGVNQNLAQPTRPFQKEPELSQQRVFRSALEFGRNTNNSIALIWDQPKHKLYLDLNRNLDLTDDPGGVFTSTNTGLQQSFARITVPLKTTRGVQPAVLDLQCYTDEKGGWAYVHLSSCSLWQAKVNIADQDWQVAAVDGLFGREGPVAADYLLVRPWAMRTNQMYLHYPVCGIGPFPDRLFWLGRAFQVERRLEVGGATPVCKLELTPLQPPLAQLNLSGQFLYYAVLRDTNGYTVLLHEPVGTVKVPEGVYEVSAAWLKKGAAEAFRVGDKPLVIKVPAATNLVLGGPLTNCVTLERHGRKLMMNYQLKGAGGESYRLAQEDRDHPPEFMVYRGGKKVYSGKFEFG
jgi:hypothetical protein